MLFLSITHLTGPIGAIPSEAETVISQVARTVFGGQGVLYLGVIVATTLSLIMATNTSFAGFPRLGALLGEAGSTQSRNSPLNIFKTSAQFLHSFFTSLG